MTFQLRGLDPARFQPLFELPDEALAARGMRRLRADAPIGYPCRTSLVDAAVGDELLLLSFEHQPADSPYRAAGPIFVRRGVDRAACFAGELPAYLTDRLLSVRAYDATDSIVAAEVVPGAEAAPLFERLLARGDVAYLHVHFARHGCFACRVDRAAM